MRKILIVIIAFSAACSNKNEGKQNISNKQQNDSLVFKLKSKNTSDSINSQRSRSQNFYLKHGIGLVGEATFVKNSIFISKNTSDIYLKNSYWPIIGDSIIYITEIGASIFQVKNIESCLKMAQLFNIEINETNSLINFDCQLYDVGIKGDFISFITKTNKKNASSIAFKYSKGLNIKFIDEPTDIKDILSKIKYKFKYTLPGDSTVKLQYNFKTGTVRDYNNKESKIRVNDIYIINGKYILSISTYEDYSSTTYYLIEGEILIPLMNLPIA